MTTALTIPDLCDRCPAEGKALVVLPSAGELVLCGHHATKHREALEAHGAAIVSGDTEPEPTQPISVDEIRALDGKPASQIRVFYPPREMSFLTLMYGAAAHDPWFEVEPDKFILGTDFDAAKGRYAMWGGDPVTPTELRQAFPGDHFEVYEGDK